MLKVLSFKYLQKYEVGCRRKVSKKQPHKTLCTVKLCVDQNEEGACCVHVNNHLLTVTQFCDRSNLYMLFSVQYAAIKWHWKINAVLSLTVLIMKSLFTECVPCLSLSLCGLQSLTSQCSGMWITFQTLTDHYSTCSI